MRRWSFLIGIAIALGTTANSNAAVYNFTLDSIDYDVVGQIVTTGNLVTSMTGQITGLLNAPISGVESQFNVFFTSDNLINFTGGNFIDPLSPTVSNSGILFNAGGYFFNIYSVSNDITLDYFIATNQLGSDYFTSPLFNPGSQILNGTIAAIPELSTWFMMIIGFAGLAVVGARREPRLRRLFPSFVR